MGTEGDGPPRFAPSFEWGTALLTDEAIQDKYISMMLAWDGRFAAPGRGITQCGLTQDHVGLDASGNPGGGAGYTAASKESLHISMLALVVASEPLAWHWIAGAQDEAAGKHMARARLASIIGCYERMRERFPGCGGFIPWVGVNAEDFACSQWDGFKPSGDDEVKLPALDNGQLAWSFIAAATALEQSGTPEDVELSKRFWDHVDVMAKAAKALFFNPVNGTVRMVTTVTRSREPVDAATCRGEGALGDPYEGELMLMFMDLMCILSPDELDRMWAPVKNCNIAATYTHEGLPYGPITVQRGWRFSSHELWKYMVLPYTDHALVKRVLANGERARTWNSHLLGIPGLLGSCYLANGNYCDTQGIPSVSMGYRPVADSELMITPYGAFPLMLVERGAGLAWHRAMLARPRMQCSIGSVEAGQALAMEPKVACKTSWDTKVSADLAALGGTCRLLGSFLDSDPEGKRRARFNSLLDWLHERFSALQGEATPFAPPPTICASDDCPCAEVDFPGCERLSPKVALVVSCSSADGDGAIDISGSWAHPDGADLSIMCQTGSSVRATNPVQAWSPAEGTIDGNCISLFGLTGEYHGDTISWSNGITWTRADT